MSLRRVCVFCGSSVGFHDEYRTAATLLADALVARNIGVVFGGGKVGLMGVLADSVLERGGEEWTCSSTTPRHSTRTAKSPTTAWPICGSAVPCTQGRDGRTR